MSSSAAAAEQPSSVFFDMMEDNMLQCDIKNVYGTILLILMGKILSSPNEKLHLFLQKFNFFGSIHRN